MDPVGITLPVLKGDAFAAELDRACAGPLPSDPWDDLKHRRILIPHMVGGELEFALMGLLAQAMRIRGAQVVATLCDAFLPACVVRKVDHHTPACVRWCFRNSERFSSAMQLEHQWHSRFITPEEKHRCARLAASIKPEEIPLVEHHGIEVGKLVVPSVESYFKVGAYEPDNPAMVAKAYEFLLSAFYLDIVIDRAFDEFRIDKLFTDSGMHVDWGMWRAVAARKSIPADVMNIGLRGRSVKLEIDRPGRETDFVPGWDQWRHQPLTDEQNRQLDAYLSRREKVPYEFKGEQWQGRITDDDRVRRIIGLPERVDGLVFSMFPNVGYDAGKTRHAAAFDVAREWVLQTIRFFADHPRHHLLVKIHPGELHRGALDPTLDHINNAFPTLPPNVHVVPPTTDATAHSIIRLGDVALVYTSTVAVEAAALGRPVILAGGGRHARHGVTIDVASPEEYFRLLADACAGRRTLAADIELGRRYAYSIFFRADVPITHFLMYDVDVAALQMTDWDDLRPGRQPAIDAICRAILCDAPFEAPSEVALHTAGASA